MAISCRIPLSGAKAKSMVDLALYQTDCVSAARSVLRLSDRGSSAVDGPALYTKEGIEASVDDLQHRMACMGFPERQVPTLLSCETGPRHPH